MISGAAAAWRPMRVSVLQHVPFEGLGSMAPWLEERGARISWSRLHEKPELPDLAIFDWLIVLGGPRSANDAARLPWLVPEKRLIAEAISAGKVVLGICLGAQMIASCLGARIYPNEEREIGWLPVERVGDPGKAGPADFLPAKFDAFHWHGETFDLPAGAVRIARSEACENQAFLVGDRVVGLQFHLESTPAAARALIESCPEDLRPGRFVQDAEEILRDPGRFERANRLMASLLEDLERRDRHRSSAEPL